MKIIRIPISILVLLVCLSCVDQQLINDKPGPKGTLYIIGGGKRPEAMVREMISLSGADSSGYIIILPMASEEPDSSAFYAARQFSMLGIQSIAAMNILDANVCSHDRLDSIRGAAMIYITGGDQQRFMDIVLQTPVHEAIRSAFNEGSLIAGTSAGAAVMSRLMITGNEFKHPEYTGDFRTIEAGNMEIKEGLGLVDDIIVDQHFVKRMRMNRLISVALENPGVLCAGIDEATALVIHGRKGRVSGESQVILIRFDGIYKTNEKGLIAGRGLQLDILLPGESFNY
ncbi:MAG: cyanophycinase [Bacteroidetes bacterium]|nr:cyanophycinase [Bacteroidota bacterium]